MPADNNAQLLITVSSSTLLGSSILKNVTLNGTTVSTNGAALSSFLYSGNVIELEHFKNELIFGFGGLSQHERLITRARVYAQCSNSVTTVQSMITLVSAVNTTETQLIPLNAQKVLEGQV